MPSQDREFVLKFPMELDACGGIACDMTPLSELFLVSTVVPTQRLDDQEFGISAIAYEQDQMQVDTQRLLTLLAVQVAIQAFVPDMLIASLNVFKTTEEKRQVIDISFIDTNSADELSNRALVELDLTSTSGSGAEVSQSQG